MCILSTPPPPSRFNQTDKIALFKKDSNGYYYFIDHFAEISIQSLSSPCSNYIITSYFLISYLFSSTKLKCTKHYSITSSNEIIKYKNITTEDNCTVTNTFTDHKYGKGTIYSVLNLFSFTF